MIEYGLLILLERFIFWGNTMFSSEIEQYLKQIKCVNSCKILLDNQGDIEEIHVVSGSRRNPKQISRDIQSILISKFDLNIDHKKISIAQIEDDLIEKGDFRLKLRTVEYSITDMKTEIKVVLEKDNELYEGLVSGPNTLNNTQRLLGKATLRAVEKCLGLEDAFVLEDIKILHAAGKEVVIAAVTFIFNNTERLLSGSAIVYDDKKDAIVKATLDAINRIVLIIPE